jgi:hypothetical protein
MGKKGSKNRGARRGGRNGRLGGNPMSIYMPNAGKITFTGSAILITTLAAGSNLLSLTPQGVFGSALTQFCTLFDSYRFVALEFICFGPIGASTGYVLNYTPQLIDVPSTTIPSAIQSPNSLYIPTGAVSTVPYELKISRKTLLDTSARWWKCNTSAGVDTWDQIQGTINITAGTNTPAVTVEVKYVIQFNDLHASSSSTFESSPRKSAVLPTWESLPVMDLYIPDSPFPYPKDRSVDADFKRVDTAYRKLHPSNSAKEFARLTAQLL